MRMNLGAYGDEGEQVPAQAQRVGILPPDVVAMLQGLAATVRRLDARVRQLEGIVTKLDANDQRLAGHVNQQLGEVDQKMMTVAKRLLMAARRGVQPQQLVPLGQERDFPVYQTPPAGNTEAQIRRMQTNPGPAAEEANPTAEEMAFYNGDDEQGGDEEEG